MRISEVTRRDIFDAIIAVGISWNGRLTEPEFLSRIFDLKNMPSDDPRFQNAYEDISQHRINNCDWRDDWIFYDSRFNLLHTDDETFLKLLCEMLHPTIRSDSEEVERLKEIFNKFLRRDGYEIVERTRISGRPVFTAIEFKYSMPLDELLTAINTQKNLMIAVATRGPLIDSVNDEYKKRYQQIRKALSERNIEDPNPYSDLWLWYGKWSSGDLPSWQSRRQYLHDLFNPLIEKLSESAEKTILGPPREPTGWARVDRGIDAVRRALESASTEEDFQAVGLRCRETLISLAQAVYDSAIHTPLDGVQPSETDAKRMLEAFIAKELSGGENEAVRRHAKASLSLANDLVHHRTANFRSAALCSEATASVVNIIAIISGKRDPNP